jgi:hypothetical protein
LVDHLDLIGAIAAFEMGLQNLGYSHALGSGTAAAMRTLA